jgi:hypothetical protein
MMRIIPLLWQSTHERPTCRLLHSSVLFLRPGADQPLIWPHGEVRTPPVSAAARNEAGALLRRLQRSDSKGLPQSRPMPSIGRRRHELRMPDEDAT